MLLKMRKNLFVAIAFIGILSSCSEYQRVVKSPDMDYKLKKAIEYFDKGKYNKAYPLFDELLTQFRGSSKAEEVYFYYCETQYKLEDYILAGYHYKNFYRTFPNSTYSDEAAYKAAYCHYLESPKYSLDQSYTYKALNDLQLYVNTHPKSTKIEECNQIMDELRHKLEKKSYEIARQYYYMQLFQSAVSAFNTTLNDFPDTPYREEILFFRLLSSYELADKSVEDKKFQRYKETITAYNELVDYFPETEYKIRAEEVKNKTEENIKGIKLNN